MKRFLFTLTLVLLAFQVVQATTYFKNWVNGTATDTLVQGDMYAWEFDVSIPGGSAQVQIYVDADHNRALDDQDVLLVGFTQQDGDEGNDGPGDSSSVQDGIVYTFLGPMGFPEGDYLFKVTDLNDNSTVVGTLHINPMPNVTVWITGQLKIENVTPPDARLANFMFEAELDRDEDGPGVFWAGLTDENGNFTINLPDTAVGNTWKVGFMFENQFASFSCDTVSYHNVVIHSGENGVFRFLLKNPRAWVYGSLQDDLGNVIPMMGWGSIENLHSGQESEFNMMDGHYQVAASFAGDDTSNVPFRLNFWCEELVPNYMMPDTWENPMYEFSLSYGDSLEKNIVTYRTDTVIYVIALKDGHPMQDARAWARNDNYGQSFANLNGDSVVAIHVRSGAPYFLWLTNTDYGDFDPPMGYYLDGNWQEAFPGDTVVFNLLPTNSRIKGHIYLPPTDTLAMDALKERSVIQAYTENWEKHFSTPINLDSMGFSLFLPNGTYNVRFDCWSGDYLARPAEYQNIVINNSVIDTLNFELRYAHAHIKVKLHGAPVDDPTNFWMHIQTEGYYPNVFEANEQMRSDTSFVFRVCAGRWIVYAPDFGPEYVPNTQQTTVEVTADSEDYAVDFYYTATGIEDNDPIPTSFYVRPNYPNPFNPSTTIEFGLPVQEHVRVVVYNLSGQKVATLVDGVLPAGVHKVIWQAGDKASGMYFYKVQTPHKTVVKRMLFIK